MPENTFTTTTQTSYVKKIGSSIQSVLFGFLLIIGAIVLLFSNENRSVKRTRTLATGEGQVVEATSTLDKQLDGKLVHLSGEATTTETLVDDNFALSLNAIKLKRNVEMFQWVEEKEEKTEDKLGGGSETTTTYNYNQEWSDSFHDSSDFEYREGHENPSEMPYEKMVKEASKVNLADYTLSKDLITQMNNYESVNLTSALASQAASLSGKNLSLQNQYFFIGDNYQNPQIGDVRINFEVVKPALVSIVAKQEGSQLGSLQTKTGLLALLDYGQVSASEMFATARSENNLLTWILRGVGVLLIFIGLKMITSIAKAIADVVPLIGDIVDFSTSVIALLVSLAIGIVVIAIAWFTVRPLLSIILIAISLGCIVLAKMNKKKTNPQTTVTPSPVSGTNTIEPPTTAN